MIELAAAEGRTDPHVADEVSAWALRGATGVIAVGGDPGGGGTVYLEDGCVTFAESPAAPDIATRLIGSRRLSGEQWRRLSGEAHPGRPAGALLVERGYITADDLHAVARSAVLDALLALTRPLAPGPISTATIGFTPRRRHPGGFMVRLDAETVQEEVEHANGRLARLGVPPGARPRLCDLNRRCALVNSGQWIVACTIDGVATVRELAWRHGFALHETIERVGELAGSGLCTLPAPVDSLPADPEGQPTSMAGAAGFMPAPADAQVRSGAALPGAGSRLSRPASPRSELEAMSEAAPGGALPLARRNPRATAWTGPEPGAEAPGLRRDLPRTSGQRPAPASLDVMRRVLDGLRRLPLPVLTLAARTTRACQGSPSCRQAARSNPPELRRAAAVLPSDLLAFGRCRAEWPVPDDCEPEQNGRDR